ncbi:MAG: hypothetical protein OQJ84_04230, partial [Xanthomonadales bacterium]|nr:hypothetical protein [Xanthomonadales bacterium]
NADLVSRQVTARVSESGIAEVVDLRDLVIQQESPECGFYMDHVHLNMAGKQMLTDTLLPELEKFWAALPGAVNATAY